MSKYDLVGYGWDDTDDYVMGDEYASDYDDEVIEGEFDDDYDDEVMGDEYDIVGDGEYELVGDEDEFDEIGRRRRRRPRGRSRRRRRVVRRAAAPRRRRALVRKAHTRDRGLLLPFGSTGTLAPGDSVDLPANPQVPFRPKRLVVQQTAGTSIVVNDIKVGKNSQLVSSGQFPGSAFDATAFDIGFKFDTATPGIDITVTLQNAAAAGDASATVGMFGYSAVV